MQNGTRMPPSKALNLLPRNGRLSPALAGCWFSPARTSREVPLSAVTMTSVLPVKWNFLQRAHHLPYAVVQGVKHGCVHAALRIAPWEAVHGLLRRVHRVVHAIEWLVSETRARAIVVEELRRLHAKSSVEYRPFSGTSLR
jgi:hypothetical protein